MSRLTLRSPNITFSIWHGSEGPKHDPYSYTEIEVRRKKKVVLLHSGLADFVKVNDKDVNLKKITGKKIDMNKEGHHLYDVVTEAFTKLTGYTPQEIEKMLRKYENKQQSRCSQCGGKPYKSSEGFPGESLTLCKNNHVMYCDFNESAIM